jgi:hypothetical protein
MTGAPTASRISCRLSGRSSNSSWGPTMISTAA